MAGTQKDHYVTNLKDTTKSVPYKGDTTPSKPYKGDTSSSKPYKGDTSPSKSYKGDTAPSKPYKGDSGKPMSNQTKAALLKIIDAFGKKK